jgi:SWI/SNF-related matrix-associated actin-dependent regulator 1 of chromatin subfamily A
VAHCVKPTLFKHQLETVEFYKKNLYCLNTSEAGTGKTFPSIEMAIGKKTLVVAPAFLCRNWKREFAKFGINAKLYTDKGPASDYNIVSMDQIYKNASLFHDLDVLIVDECHNFCTLDTRRTKALHSYVSEFQPKRLYLLSGTPMRNRIPELYSLLLLLDYRPQGGQFKKSFPSSFSFCNVFCHHMTKQIPTKHGKRTVHDFTGFKNKELLRGWIKPLVIKYCLDQIEEIPEISYEDVVAELEEEPELLLWSADETLSAGWESMGEFDTAPPANISSAKLESAKSKIPFTLNYCKNLLDGGEDALVVFSDHVYPAKTICEGLASYGSAVITGATPMAERDRLVQLFQAGKLRVIVGTIGAAGTGITLTAARYCVRNDRSWVPAQNAQAAGRLRRLTQKRKVRIIDIVSEGIDAKIAKKLREKERLIIDALG